MTDYRLYFIRADTNRFMGAADLKAVDDEDAVRQAQRHEGAHPMELWCLNRLVRSFPPEGCAALAAE